MTLLTRFYAGEFLSPNELQRLAEAVGDWVHELVADEADFAAWQTAQELIRNY